MAIEHLERPRAVQGARVAPLPAASPGPATAPRAAPVPVVRIGLQVALGYEWLASGLDKVLYGHFPAALGGLLAGVLGGVHIPAPFAALLRAVVLPHAALFGEKDWQQLAVIRRMATDLSVPVEVRGVDTVRDTDGLAASSRNVFLSPDERRRAVTLYRALQALDPALCEGEVEYLAVVDPDTFHEVVPVPGTLVIGAARFGDTRLIDNIRIEQS